MYPLHSQIKELKESDTKPNLEHNAYCAEFLFLHVDPDLCCDVINSIASQTAAWV